MMCKEMGAASEAAVMTQFQRREAEKEQTGGMDIQMKLSGSKA